MTKAGDVLDNDMIRAVYEHLGQRVTKQDDLVHIWTKYYLSIQAALYYETKGTLVLKQLIDRRSKRM